MALKARLSIPTSGLMEAVHLPPVLWGLRKKCSELLISYLIQQNVMGIFRVPLITPPQKVRPYYSKGLFSGTMMGFITAEIFRPSFGSWQVAFIEMWPFDFGLSDPKCK